MVWKRLKTCFSFIRCLNGVYHLIWKTISLNIWIQDTNFQVKELRRTLDIFFQGQSIKISENGFYNQELIFTLILNKLTAIKLVKHKF